MSRLAALTAVDQLLDIIVERLRAAGLSSLTIEANKLRAAVQLEIERAAREVVRR